MLCRQENAVLCLGSVQRAAAIHPDRKEQKASLLQATNGAKANRFLSPPDGCGRGGGEAQLIAGSFPATLETYFRGLGTEKKKDKTRHPRISDLHTAPGYHNENIISPPSTRSPRASPTYI